MRRSTTIVHELHLLQSTSQAEQGSCIILRHALSMVSYMRPAVAAHLAASTYAFEPSQVKTMGDVPAALPYAVNPLPFAGKVISITGASRGLGLALSKYLLIRGATVSMCATSAENLSKAAKEIDTELPDAKGRYWTCVADIASLDSVRSWIEMTVEKFGKLDGCANVAGESLGSGLSLHR
jgi:3-oxoacyl-ACP reductase-like protein